MTKPGLPQGTRDFSPETVRKRAYILNTIRSVFELFGFQPLETPAMENLDTLMGKYGEEGDKLIFRVLNNGLNDPKNIDKARAAFENTLSGRYDKNLTERALRYDLTIPFARYVAMNFGQLTMPFRRYQVQPVWRADRPQKGRYREFYQCDADVVGSKSLMNEVELALIYHQVFKNLHLDQAEIRINSRKILSALALRCGGANNLTPITIAIDKLDKIGMEGVRSELSARGISADHAALIERYLSVDGSNAERLKQIRAIVGNSEEGEAGIAELEFMLENTGAAEPLIGLKVDFTLARGLNYYTGIIFEAKAPPQVSIGSIGGGGRYDDLTGLFGVPNVPGVGISFGVDRIYDVLEELKLFPADVSISTKLLFLNSDAATVNRALLLAQQLRHAGVSCEIYPESVKIDKQYKYAEKKAIPLVGTFQSAENSVRIKNISTGEVATFNFSDIDEVVKFINK